MLLLSFIRKDNCLGDTAASSTADVLNGIQQIDKPSGFVRVLGMAQKPVLLLGQTLHQSIGPGTGMVSSDRRH